MKEHAKTNDGPNHVIPGTAWFPTSCTMDFGTCASDSNCSGNVFTYPAMNISTVLYDCDVVPITTFKIVEHKCVSVAEIDS